MCEINFHRNQIAPVNTLIFSFQSQIETWLCKRKLFLELVWTVWSYLIKKTQHLVWLTVLDTSSLTSYTQSLILVRGGVPWFPSPIVFINSGLDEFSTISVWPTSINKTIHTHGLGSISQVGSEVQCEKFVFDLIVYPRSCSLLTGPSDEGIYHTIKVKWSNKTYKYMSSWE